MNKFKTSQEIQVWTLLIILALIWGSSFILMDKGLESFSPYEVGGLRMIIAAVCLSPFAIRYYSSIHKKDWKIFPILGLIGNAIPAFLFPLAETQINSATAGILNALTPVFALIVGIAFFSVAFSWKKMLGIVIGLGGALCVILGGKSVGLSTNISYSLLIVLATAMYGTSVNVMKKYLNDVPPLAISAYSFFFAAVPYMVYLPFSHAPATLMAGGKAWESFGYIFILGALGSSASTVAFYYLVQITDAVRSSSVTYLMPIIACMWGLLRTDKELITMIQLLGMAVILAGVYMLNQKSAPVSESQPESALLQQETANEHL